MLTSDKLKQKTCKSCGKKYKPFSSLQKVCSVACSLAFVQEQEKKKILKSWNKETRKRKEQIKTRNDWIKETQKTFNRYVRLRDNDLPCISCNRIKVEYTPGGMWDCGHYLSVGAYPELRFEELNAHKQCKSCNAGSGKYASKGKTVAQDYRKNLIKRIDINMVEWLEGPHEPKKYTIEELKEIKQFYKDKIKKLKEG